MFLHLFALINEERGKKKDRLPAIFLKYFVILFFRKNYNFAIWLFACTFCEHSRMTA